MRILTLVGILICTTLLGFSQDYVILKSGEKLKGKIEILNIQSSDFNKAKIKLDGEILKSTQVASFECDGIYYGNVDNQIFSQAKIRGKINLFSFKVYSKSLGIETLQHCSYGVQKNETEEVQKLTYNNLKQMIADDLQAVKELEQIGSKQFKKELENVLNMEYLMALNPEANIKVKQTYEQMLDLNKILILIKNYNSK